MLKHVGLSICLCLLAMGLNRVFAAQTVLSSVTRHGAHSVTIGSNEHAEKAVTRPLRKSGQQLPAAL